MNGKNKMRQIIHAAQSIIKGNFIFFLVTACLLIPTVACAQIIESPDEQVETTPEPLWPEKNKVVPPITPNPLSNQNQEAPYGTVLMTQKTVSCNNTPVIQNYIQNMGGMAPITFGTNLNQMGAITSLIQMYANPINKQFAVVEHFATQKSCILTQGHNFEMLVMPEQGVIQ